MNILFIIIMVFSICCFGANVNTAALEIVENNYESFAPYGLYLRYDTNSFSFSKPISQVIYQTENNNGYFFDNISLNHDKTKAYIYIFSPTSLMISDLHEIELKTDATTFLKLYKSNEPCVNNVVCENIHHDDRLPYYELIFKLKKYESPIIYVALLMPLRFSKSLFYAPVRFKWVIKDNIFNSINQNNDINNYLVIGSSDVIMEKINVTGLQQYDLIFTTNNFSSGEYWWQIVGELNSNTVFRSKANEFYLVNQPDEIDTDGDGFTDNDEIIRGFDHEDARSYPLLIITDNTLPLATEGQHYFHVLKCKGSNNNITWVLRSVLPGGLNLSRSGVLSGIPSNNGNFEIEVFACDGVKFDEKVFLIDINSPQNSVIDGGNGSIE